MLLGILGFKSFTKMRCFALLELLTLVLFSLIIGCVVSKECTNTFPELSSHTFRYALLTSKNETWKHEILSQSHYHLTPTDDTYWDSLLPKRMMGQQSQISWLSLYRQIKYDKGVNQNGNFLKAVSLSDVRLDPNSMYGRAQQTNLEYLLMLDVDRLVWSFRKTAGLDTPGEPHGGWEAANVELRGHFVGHFLSASAHMWASTNNDTLKDKMFEVVSILSECQKKIGSGYLSAFPTEFFDKFEALQTIWAPYYTIHKIMAGLLDQYLFAGNEEAFTMLKGMVDYHYDRVRNVVLKYSIQRQWSCLNEETGGMNDILYRLYSITGDQKHLLLAHLFDKPCFLGELAVQADDIAGFHSNTHIPVVIGAQMRYEVTGDPLYKDIGTFFMDIINSSHAYATGGTSVSEFWSDPKRLATTLETENEESCTTYNMLKVSRNLFRWSKEMRYADYYERALINGVLSIQRGKEPGVMIYMLPLKPGGSKAIGYHGWGNPFNSFWCCYGTGIESFSKLGDSIYFEEEGKVPGLYIIQYIPSSFKWKSGGFQLYLRVNPVVSWKNRFQVTVIIASRATAPSTLNLRIPTWTNAKAANAILNNQNLDLPAAGNSLSVTKWWSPGDQISLELPISLQLEAIKDDRPEYASLHAILYGPYLLAGLSNGDWDIKAAANASLTDWISPIQADYNDYLISLSQESGNTSLSLVAYLDSVRLHNSPEPGTNDAVNATIRLILKEPDANFSSPRDAIGKSVMLEPYGLPGMLVAHQDIDEPLYVIPSSSDESSVFHLVPGLDGAKETVSLESASHKGCYIVSGPKHKSGAESLTLSCKSKSSLSDFSEAASFKMDKGINEYHPISFVANGANRNFLLVPLLSLRDEHYTVYFNI